MTKSIRVNKYTGYDSSHILHSSTSGVEPLRAELSLDCEKCQCMRNQVALKNLVTSIELNHNIGEALNWAREALYKKP